MTPSPDPARTHRRGLVAGLAAAVLFGIFTPLSKSLVHGVGPLALSALLYLGAGVGTALVRRAQGARGPGLGELEPGERRDLAIQVLVGGVVAPVAMLAGLERLSALAGSLLLNLEGPFTLGLALGLFGERLGRREALGCACVLAGALVLALGPGELAASPEGVALMTLAGASWALDNNLIRRLARLDPILQVQVKGLVAGSLALALDRGLGGTLPAPGTLALCLALGALCFGTSIVLHVEATRVLGAARQGTLMAAAPFLGALVAVVALGDPLEGRHLVAAALMVPGMLAISRGEPVAWTPGPG